MSNPSFERSYEHRISKANAAFESSWKSMLVGLFIEFGQVDRISGIVFD
jgi:hypothetical protein